MVTYVVWGVVGILVGAIVVGIAVGAVTASHTRKRARTLLVVVVWSAIIGLALWCGPLFTAECARRWEARTEAYLASFPQQRVTVAGTEIVLGSHSVSTDVYGVNVLTREFPTQKILIHRCHGVMDVREGECLTIWLDGWVAVKVVRHAHPSPEQLP